MPENGFANSRDTVASNKIGRKWDAELRRKQLASPAAQAAKRKSSFRAMERMFDVDRRRAR